MNATATLRRRPLQPPAAHAAAARGTRWVHGLPLANMRDLGGLPAQAGTSRRGVVFRSATLSGIGADEARIVAQLIRTFVDLRTPQELAVQGTPSALVDAGVEWVSLPVASPRPVDAAGALAAWKTLLIERRVPLRAIVETCVARGPVCIGCSAGKDRTGLVASLLLLAIGVRPRAVAADYALTGRFFRRVDGDLNAWGTTALPAAERARRLETPRRTVTALVDWIVREHGGTQNLLAWLDVDDDLASALRERLVEPPAGAYA